MLVILSETFSGGGAERVLALLANGWTKSDGPLRLLSLSLENSYLNHDRVVEIFNRKMVKEPRLNRLLNIFTAGCSIKKSSTVLVCSYILLLVITPISWIKGFKLIFRPSIDYDYISNEVSNRLGTFFGKLLLGILKICFKSSRLVYQTPVIKNSFEKGVGRHLIGQILPNPVSVDNNSFPPYVNPSNKLPLDILLVGRLVPEKGFDRFINSIKVDVNKFRVQLYGVGPELDNLKNIAASKNIELVSHGFKNLRNSNISAGLFVVPSYVEGFPNVVLEAALAGWPIIISKEVSNCISGSPVAGFCNVMDFDHPLLFDELNQIMLRHSTEDSFEEIFQIRQAHSLESYKRALIELISQ